MGKPTSLIYHIEIESKNGYEHDDEDAWSLYKERQPDILAAGGEATFCRSFGARGQGGTHTIIVLILPITKDPTKQAKPEQFFSETDQVRVAIRDLNAAEQPNDLPKGTQEISPIPPEPAPEAPHVTG